MAAIAGDQGSERISEANVILTLIDANDNAPVFDQVITGFWLVNTDHVISKLASDWPIEVMWH